MCMYRFTKLVKMVYSYLIVLLYYVSCIDGFSYEYYEELSGWLKLHYLPATWHAARLRCRLEGGRLASPTTAEWRAAMLTEMELRKRTPRGVFTGIHATFSKGDFFSIEGVPLDDMPLQWAPGEPDNEADEEACLAMSAGGEVADVSCESLRPYLCYVKSPAREPGWDACGRFNQGYHFDNSTGSCYKLHTLRRPWALAYQACAAEGAHLIIINSFAESQVFSRLLGDRGAPDGGEHALVGVHDWSVPGDWQTIHGETLAKAGYSVFRGGGGGCGAVLRSGELAAVACDTASAFLCEKRPT